MRKGILKDFLAIISNSRLFLAVGKPLNWGYQQTLTKPNRTVENYISYYLVFHNTILRCLELGCSQLLS